MKKLTSIGFPKNEANIYVTLLRLGPSTVSDITQASGVHRRNVYDALERLMKKGLAGFRSDGKKKIFVATSPTHIIERLNEEKDVLKKKEKQAKSVVIDLLKIRKDDADSADIVIYKGVKGIKTVLGDVLKTEQENLVLGAHKPPKPINKYLEWFHKQRLKSGFKEKLIFNKDDMKRAERLSKTKHTGSYHALQH